MTGALANIIALIFVAAVLSAVMLIAWHSFGRPRHALIWAAAFSVAGVEWIADLWVRTFADGNSFACALLCGLSFLSNALIAIGFVQRSRENANVTPLLIIAAAAAVLTSAGSIFVPHPAIRDAIWLLFGGSMLAVSATMVTRSLRSATLPERATALMLLVLALLDIGTAAALLRQGAVDSSPTIVMIREVLLVVQPLPFIGVCVFTVFLISVDLAEYMRAQATSDMLTGIYNRRGFEESAERAIRNAQRQRQPLAVVISDIDNFKALNDRFGHSAGDRALKHFAGRLERMIRRGDLIGRIGGEEFALLLVNTGAQNALEVVERIRRDIAAMPVDGSTGIRMTASFGVTGLRPGDTALSGLLSRADRALYRSKADGRDRVTSAETIVEELWPVI